MKWLLVDSDVLLAIVIIFCVGTCQTVSCIKYKECIAKSTPEQCKESP